MVNTRRSNSTTNNDSSRESSVHEQPVISQPPKEIPDLDTRVARYQKAVSFYAKRKIENLLTDKKKKSLVITEEDCNKFPAPVRFNIICNAIKEDLKKKTP